VIEFLLGDSTVSKREISQPEALSSSMIEVSLKGVRVGASTSIRVNGSGGGGVEGNGETHPERVRDIIVENNTVFISFSF
jgi:hypothetical protein